MVAQDIIKKFELYVDDATELSSQDELDLLNKKYQEVCSDRPWEFLKKGYSNSINGTSIALPDDFQYILDTQVHGIVGRYVFVDEKYYQLVNFQDRSSYKNSGYCWVNLADETLEFSSSVSGTLTYDYVSFPEDLDATDEPIFPARYHHILYHLMASDDYAIQQFDKAKSYARENEQKAEKLLEQMAIWNASLQV